MSRQQTTDPQKPAEKPIAKPVDSKFAAQQAPTLDPDPPKQSQSERLPERSWLNIDFSGFESDDKGSSLFRRWTGKLRALRSDHFLVTIDIASEQRDGPLRVGEDLVEAFGILESYRNCSCSARIICNEHKIGE